MPFKTFVNTLLQSAVDLEKLEKGVMPTLRQCLEQMEKAAQDKKPDDCKKKMDDFKKNLQTTLLYLVENQEKFKNLQPGQALHIDQKSPNIPYSLQIIHARNGEWLLVINEDVTNWRRTGSDKNIQATLTCRQKQWERGADSVAAGDKITEAKQGCKIGEIVNSIDMNPLIAGAIYRNVSDGQRRQSFYAPLADLDLHDALDDKESKSPISAIDIFSVFYSLTRGLAAMHAAGFIHQDLKPRNILLQRDEEGFLWAKINDLDRAVHKKEKIPVAAAAVGYVAPELFSAMCQRVTAGNYTIQEHEHAVEYWDLQKMTQEIIGKIIKKQGITADIAPHEQNDIYSLGIIIHKMIEKFEDYSRSLTKEDTFITTKLAAINTSIVESRREDRDDAAKLIQRLDKCLADMVTKKISGAEALQKKLAARYPAKPKSEKISIDGLSYYMFAEIKISEHSLGGALFESRSKNKKHKEAEKLLQALKAGETGTAKKIIEENQGIFGVFGNGQLKKHVAAIEQSLSPERCPTAIKSR